jgi:acyl-CoA reductase-like NAD-dependent aldehyde dehydrogenase
VVNRPRLLVGGVLRDAAHSYPVIDPATEQEIARAPDASDADVDEAIAAARQAFDQTTWAADPGQRARCLRQLKSALDEDFAARLRTGTVGINGGVWFSPDVPFGGYKQSGIGREIGVPGFEEYLQIKSVAEPAGD